jgi:hypothetical protein
MNDPDPIKTEATDLVTGRSLEAEILTEAQSRERRRQHRRRLRQALESDRTRGLRILSQSARHLSKGNATKAVETIFNGFGQLLIDAARRRLR